MFTPMKRGVQSSEHPTQPFEVEANLIDAVLCGYIQFFDSAFADDTVIAEAVAALKGLHRTQQCWIENIGSGRGGLTGLISLGIEARSQRGDARVPHVRLDRSALRHGGPTIRARGESAIAGEQRTHRFVDRAVSHFLRELEREILGLQDPVERRERSSAPTLRE